MSESAVADSEKRTKMPSTNQRQDLPTMSPIARSSLLASALLLSLAGLDGCAKAPADPASSAAPAGSSSAIAVSARRVSGAEARTLVASGARLLDVRTPEEFSKDGIQGAVNIPYDQIQARASELGGKDQQLVVYCHSGRRSAIAARTLTHLGYSKVADLGPRSSW